MRRFLWRNEILFIILYAIRKWHKGLREHMMDKTKIEELLNVVRPALQADGGDVELVEISDDGVIKVRLTGACGGCPMSQITLKEGIERYMKEAYSDIKAVEAV
jgi:Fe-S cluster biogenesis protein NfuA